MRLKATQRAQQRRIAKAVAELDFALPGSVVVRNTRCGSPGCACHAEPPKLHGPYIVWTRKVAAKTVTKVLTEEQLRDYQPWLDNARKLRSLVTELHDLTLQIVEADPRFNRS
jgi:hypothetical protein